MYLCPRKGVCNNREEFLYNGNNESIFMDFFVDESLLSSHPTRSKTAPAKVLSSAAYSLHFSVLTRVSANLRLVMKPRSLHCAPPPPKNGSASRYSESAYSRHCPWGVAKLSMSQGVFSCMRAKRPHKEKREVQCSNC